MKDLTILVTGGAGFIGSNLANKLAVQNEVIAIDNEYLGTPDNLDKSVDFRRIDVLDKNLPTDVHDYNFKIKNAQKFLTKGDKVKFIVKFKGRELQHANLGVDLMKRIQEDTKIVGKTDQSPKFEGKQMTMVIQPL